MSRRTISIHATPPPRSLLLARIRSAAVVGVDALAVDVEIDIANGLPSFTTVGLPLGAVKEGRERVAAALGNSGYQLPLRRITVNLAPADVPKRGSAFDLPIAIGILVASGQIPHDRVSRTLFLGELGLEGDLRPIRGALPIALAARAMECDALILPEANVAEAAVVDGIAVRGAATLAAVCQHLSGGPELCAVRTDATALMREVPVGDVDFADVKAQSAAKRALEVAAAGAHNVLMLWRISRMGVRSHARNRPGRTGHRGVEPTATIAVGSGHKCCKILAKFW